MKIWIGKILKAYLYKDVYKEEIKGLRHDQSPQFFVVSIHPTRLNAQVSLLLIQVF